MFANLFHEGENAYFLHKSIVYYAIKPTLSIWAL